MQFHIAEQVSTIVSMAFFPLVQCTSANQITTLLDKHNADILIIFLLSP